MAPISLRPNANVTIDSDRCVIYPNFLYASFHPFFAGIESLLGRPLDGPFVPTFIKSMKVSGAFYELTAGTEDHSLWACTETELPGARLSITDVTIRSADFSQVLVELKGLEATALGSTASENSVARSLFFRTRWLVALDNLAGTAELSAMKDIGEVMDLYAHQHLSKILHVTADVSSTKELLRLLGGSRGQPCRFQTVTSFSGSEDSVGDIEGLQKVYSTLVDVSEPQVGALDLVVLSKPTDIDVKSFLKPEGTVIADGVYYSGQNMEVIFRNSSFGAHREKLDNHFSTKPLSLVMPPIVSKATEDLVSIIKVKQFGAVQTISFDNLVNTAPSAENVLVLASLDSDLFFEDATREACYFEAVRGLLAVENKNVVWVLKGASIETTNPAQSMIVGMARVARNENDKLKVITLDVADDANNVQISEQIFTIFDGPLKEDEYAARNGALLIPKIETDDGLNSKLPENSSGEAEKRPFGDGPPLVLKIGIVGLLETLAFSVDG